jgi:hypothetical protein
MAEVAGFIDRVLSAGVAGEAELASATKEVRAQVMGMCERFGMP